MGHPRKRVNKCLSLASACLHWFPANTNFYTSEATAATVEQAYTCTKIPKRRQLHARQACETECRPGNPAEPESSAAGRMLLSQCSRVTNTPAPGRFSDKHSLPRVDAEESEVRGCTSRIWEERPTPPAPPGGDLGDRELSKALLLRDRSLMTHLPPLSPTSYTII